MSSARFEELRARIEDLMEYALRLGESFGASLVEVRAQLTASEEVRVDNGVLRTFSRSSNAGIGIRLLYSGRYGFSATNRLDKASVEAAVKAAVAAAKAVDEAVSPASRPSRRDVRRSKTVRNPLDIPADVKVRIALEANRAGRDVPGIKSSRTSLGATVDLRRFVSSDGADVTVEAVLTGISQLSVAAEAGVMESVSDYEGGVGGWELIEGVNHESFSRGVSELAVKAVRARTPPAGRMAVVADQRMIGLILHEAFGHALEGDLVVAGNSVLKGRIGEAIAAPSVTVIDEGVIDGGYFIPYDDEGCPKGRTVVVREGVLKSYLTDRATATKLGQPPTGNGRAQDYSSPPLVRQTNLYMAGGDWGVEEMLQEVREGLYIAGRGARGGEVDPALGTFTFSAGPSRVIRKGELAELVRGVVLSGFILETLKKVEAVGRDVRLRASVFGGCGKGGQIVKVGAGGPHVLRRDVTVGGR